MNERVSDYWIERLAAGDLDAKQADDVKTRLAAEGRSVDEELARLRVSNAEILAERPVRVVTASIRQRLQRPPRRWWLALPLAVAAAAALVLVVRPTPKPGMGDVEDTRWKGSELASPRLFVYRHSAQGDVRLGDGSRATRGDLLQLAYQVGGPVYGVLVSLDGRGRVTVHVPEAHSATASELRSGAEVRLGSAYELDDAPAFERFLLVTAPEPFPTSLVVEAAARLASDPARARAAWLPLRAGFAQTALTLVKETP